MIVRLAPLVALSLVLASPAAAQSAAPQSEVAATPKAAAQESYARGNRLFNQAEQKHDRSLYEAAYLQFYQAFAIFPDDRILWNLIVVEMKTERYVDALRHLHAYDRRPHVADPRRNRPEFSALLDQALKSTARLAIEAPPGAPVRLDGADVGIAPFPDPLDVAPGTHKLEATLTNGKTLTATASPAAGESAHVTLAEIPSAPVATTTLEPVAPPPVQQPLPPDGPSVSWWTTPRTVGMGVAVIAVAGIGAGTGFRVASNSNASQASALRSSIPADSCAGGSSSAACVNVQNKISAASQDATLSTVSFIVGGAATATALGLLVFGGAKPTTTRTGLVNWTPLVGLGSVGVAGDF